MRTVFVAAFVLLISTVTASHINCTNPACPELCNFHGQWNHDTGVCVCDDMYYTLPTPSHHVSTSHNTTEQCTQRRKSQLTAYELNIWGMFGAPFWYLGLQGHAIAMIILFWVGALIGGIGAGVESPPVIAIGSLSVTVFSVWWIVNTFLFIANYYKDANGESLYEW